MNSQVSASDPLPGTVRRAIQRALSGAKGDADAAGRLLVTISADTADVVMSEVETVLAAADPRFWVALENARDWLYWDGSGRSVGEPAGSDTLPGLAVKVLLADGRLRERAVRLLADAKSLAALPVLGLRAADWVPSVRDVARRAIVRRLQDDPDGAVLATLAPMAFLLGGRQQGRWLVDEVTRRLTEAATGPVVSQLLTSSDTRLRRAAYQVLTETEELDLERAVLAELQDRDIVIRSRCAAYASRLAVESGSLPSARRMLASRTPLVRAEALQALNRLGDLDAIRSSLVDRSSLVRGTARFYLRPQGVDFPETYRLQLGEGGAAATPGAVAGLVEVGSADDAQLLRSLLSHPRAKVRVEALRGLEAHAPAIDGDELLALVEGDPSAAVARQAASVIAARGVVIETDRLLDMLDPVWPVPVRLAARQMLAARDSAWRLAVDVMLLADPESAVADRARRDVTAALQQQAYVPPSGRTAELLAAYLPDADRLLSTAEARLLRFVVGMRVPIGPTEPAMHREVTEAEVLSRSDEPVETSDEPDGRFERFRWLRRR